VEVEVEGEGEGEGEGAARESDRRFFATLKPDVGVPHLPGGTIRVDGRKQKRQD
jgi:hypothetical protein